MNVGEFKQLLEDQKIPDDTNLTIQFRGGLAGSTVGVKSAYAGFDWTAKQLVISPETDLVIDEWYRDLKKVSDADAAHVANALKEAVKFVDAAGKHDKTDEEIILVEIDERNLSALRLALKRLAHFQKQGF